MYRENWGGAPRPPNTPRLELDVFRVPQGEVLMTERGYQRIQVPDFDSNNPYHCSCFPEPSSKTIPTMIYDNIRCPHPEKHIQQAQADVFTYPWTVQTYYPPTASDIGSTVSFPSVIQTAPAALGGGSDLLRLKQPPFSAPTGPMPESRLTSFTPFNPNSRGHLMSADIPTVTRNRPLKSRHFHSEPPVRGPWGLTSSRYPQRSRLQNKTNGSRGHPDVPSLDLRSVNGDLTEREIFKQTPGIKMRGHHRKSVHSNPRYAAATPQALKPPSQNYPQTPQRLFVGEYRDPRDGRTYKYNVKYGHRYVRGQQMTV